MPVVELKQSHRTVWVMLPNESQDGIEIEKINKEGYSCWGIEIRCTSVYKLPGMVVQALAQIEELNGNGVKKEITMGNRRQKA